MKTYSIKVNNQVMTLAQAEYLYKVVNQIEHDLKRRFRCFELNFIDSNRPKAVFNVYCNNSVSTIEIQEAV